ncbi:hypothetical protein B0I35DRAFT_435903 [Stachybotrys elegans]|uniref:Uncharacterized protein n=1 Tax=Stachybotrys elegans TaxID=80388 RepID=A0A8K0SSK6_9HYPO|nr:hypothetical protein B0I35DRAFT_435903 [Stachybotrys elegans]
MAAGQLASLVRVDRQGTVRGGRVSARCGLPSPAASCHGRRRGGTLSSLPFEGSWRLVRAGAARRSESGYP